MTDHRMTRAGLRTALTPVLAILLLALVLAGSSCGGHKAGLSSQPRTGTAPSTTPLASSAPISTTGPGGIPQHLNTAQLEKVDNSRSDFAFAVLGDNRGSTTIFDSLIAKVSSDSVLFALDNGDLVDGGTVANYRHFVDQISACTKPFLVSAGNHDDISNGIYAALFGDGYYDFTVGDSLVIVLDDSNERNIDSGQLEWLKSELSRGQAYKYRFIFMHVPLYDPRQSGESVGHSLQDLTFAKMLNGLFDQNHVTLILASHIHGYYEGVWGSTPYIISGGAGAPLQGTDPEHFFYHYVRVHVSDQGIEHEVVRI